MVNKIKNSCLFVLIVLICLTLSGCSTLPGSQGSVLARGQELQISDELRFEDLPLPRGFLLLRKNSYVFQNKLTRIGSLSYIGSANFEKLLDFYKRNMPLNGWGIINSVEFDKAVLNFVKEEEACIVTLEKRGMKKIVVTFNVSPLSSPLKSYENSDNLETTPEQNEEIVID